VDKNNKILLEENKIKFIEIKKVEKEKKEKLKKQEKINYVNSLNFEKDTSLTKFVNPDFSFIDL
jgi:hypothetical protein